MKLWRSGSVTTEDTHFQPPASASKHPNWPMSSPSSRLETWRSLGKICFSSWEMVFLAGGEMVWGSADEATLLGWRLRIPSLGTLICTSMHLRMLSPSGPRPLPTESLFGHLQHSNDSARRGPVTTPISSPCGALGGAFLDSSQPWRSKKTDSSITGALVLGLAHDAYVYPDGLISRRGTVKGNNMTYHQLRGRKELVRLFCC